MDMTLWTCFNEDIILLCFPNITKDVICCPVSQKMLSGPVILKTDQGSGCLATEASSWEVRNKWNKQGFVILLGLPNGIVATQEMDQGYVMLKAECVKSTL